MFFRKLLIKIICLFIPNRSLRKKIRYISNKKFTNPYSNMKLLNNSEKGLIRSFKDKYYGKRCFIIGGAPSLNEMDLSMLNDEYTFIVNRGYLLKKLNLNRSTFHVSTDYGFDKEFKDEIDTNFSKYYISLKNSKHSVKENSIKISAKSWSLENKGKFFEKDAARKLYLGQTVISGVLQLAYYMGFKEIIFIGVDLSFEGKDSDHFYEMSKEESNRSIHHSLKNKKDMYTWLEKSYKYLRDENIKILNASPAKSSLDFMKKVNYNSLFKEKEM